MALAVSSRVTVAFVNGICNTFEDAKESAQLIANQIKYSITVMYNPSSVDDIKICLCVIFGLGFSILTANPLPLVGYSVYSTSSYQKDLKDRAWTLANNIRNEYLSIDQKNHILLICHSQGTEVTSKALKHLSTETQKRITVIALGGKQIASELAGRVVNIHQGFDPIPYVISGKNRALLEFSGRTRDVTYIEGGSHALASYLEDDTVVEIIKNELKILEIKAKT